MVSISSSSVCVPVVIICGSLSCPYKMTWLGNRRINGAITAVSIFFLFCLNQITGNEGDTDLVKGLI